MKPNYPLQVVREQREREKEAAEERLGEALTALKEEKERLVGIRKQLKQLKSRCDEAMAHLYDLDEAGMLDPGVLARRKSGIEFIKQSIQRTRRDMEAQEKRVIEAERAVEAAKSALVEAMQALKAIEKHYEKWLEERKREAARKEQKLIEEISTAAYLRNTREEGDDE